MNKYEVIEELAEGNQIEKIVYRILGSSRNQFDCPGDLIQDIYLLLLEKEDGFIVSLAERGELGWYILRIARNQMLSRNSPYYYTYIKFGQQSDDLEKASHLPIED